MAGPSKPWLEPLAKAILRGAREMVRDLAMSDATFAESAQLSDEQMTSSLRLPALRRGAGAGDDEGQRTYYKEVLKQYPVRSGMRCA
jgi:hypothetical protein